MRINALPRRYEPLSREANDDDDDDDEFSEDVLDGMVMTWKLCRLLKRLWEGGGLELGGE